MSALGTRPIPALGVEGAAAGESTPRAPLGPQVFGDGVTTTPPAESGAQRGSQQQQMVMIDAGAHHQTQHACGKMEAPAPPAPPAPRYEEHRTEGQVKKEDEAEEGDDEVGEDIHLGAHTPDNRPWSSKEDDAITRMVRVRFLSVVTKPVGASRLPVL